MEAVRGGHSNIPSPSIKALSVPWLYSFSVRFIQRGQEANGAALAGAPLILRPHKQAHATDGWI